MSMALRSLWLAALFLLLCLPVASADPVVPPLLTGRVVDLADVLTSAAERDLTAQLAKVEQKTGTQIVVAILPDLGGYPIESWGLALGRTWQIGRAGKDDGIVIVLAPNDREIRIEVGYGLEGRHSGCQSPPDHPTHPDPGSFGRGGMPPAWKPGNRHALEKLIVNPTEAASEGRQPVSAGCMWCSCSALGVACHLVDERSGLTSKDEDGTPVALR
jgi:hypothetical protein